jgi:small subunit ribosomal protein S4e
MSDHMKRLAAPRSWPLKRKENVFTTKQRPGSHSVEESVPAALMLRDILKVCDTSREAKRIVGNRDLLVDGKPVRSVKAPVGIMDVVAIPAMDLYYRVVLSDKGKIAVVPITKDEATWKLAMIEDKTKVAGGKIQINFHDGRNIVLDKNQYKTGDVVKLAVPDQKIEDAFELKAGATVLIFRGKHAGQTAVVSEYIVTKDASENVVRFTDGSETVKSNVFVIGGESAAIKLPEASA